MRHLHLAELRDSWSAWLSVSLTFIMVNAAFAAAALYQVSYNKAARERAWTDLQRSGGNFSAGFAYGICGLVGLLVICSVTGLVIDSRRGSIARLALAGASPAQIVSTLMTQLAVTSLVSAIIGDLLAIPFAQLWLNQQATAGEYEHIALQLQLAPLLWANLGCAVISMLGGLRLARRATNIGPVEALREAQTASKQTRWQRIRRVVWAVLCAGLLMLMFSSLDAIAGQEDKRMALQTIMQTTIFTIPLACVVLVQLSQFTIAWFTRIWTRLVPGGGTWHLGRNTVIGKIDRLTKTVVPVLTTLALFLGMMTMGKSLQATLDAMGAGVKLSGTGAADLLTVFGPPLAIAVAGGLSGLLIMARQREAELALDGILGATPTQRIIIPILEAVMVTVTALANAVIVIVVELLFMRQGMGKVIPNYQIVVPWTDGIIATLVLLAAVGLSTLLPTLPSLRTPEPRIISRFVAS